MHRVLFLDIDGVLNSDRYFASRGAKPNDAVAEIAWHIDPSAISRLNQLISSTGATVVLSSDWRLAPKNPGLRQTELAMQSQGATFGLLDATPELTEAQRLKRFGTEWKGNFTPREFEIQAWLDVHPEVASFAIVDDEPDMGHLSEFLVPTNPAIGLTDTECVALAEILDARRSDR